MTPDGLTRLEGFARSGLNDEQIAAKMGIVASTYYKWQIDHPELSEALKRGKKPVDDEVENALLKKALGFTYEETVTEMEEVPSGKYDESGKPIMKQVKHIRKIQKMALPDTTAQIYWLKNRRPERWRDKPETVENMDALTKLDEMLAEVKKVAFNS